MKRGNIHVVIWEKSIAGRENNECKGPEAGQFGLFKELPGGGEAKWMTGREGGGEMKVVVGARFCGAL